MTASKFHVPPFLFKNNFSIIFYFGKIKALESKKQNKNDLSCVAVLVNAVRPVAFTHSNVQTAPFPYQIFTLKKVRANF